MSKMHTYMTPRADRAVFLDHVFCAGIRVVSVAHEALHAIHVERCHTLGDREGVGDGCRDADLTMSDTQNTGNNTALGRWRGWGLG